MHKIYAKVRESEAGAESSNSRKERAMLERFLKRKLMSFHSKSSTNKVEVWILDMEKIF